MDRDRDPFSVSWSSNLPTEQLGCGYLFLEILAVVVGSSTLQTYAVA